MHQKTLFVLFFLVFGVISCSQKKTFPEKQTFRIPQSAGEPVSPDFSPGQNKLAGWQKLDSLIDLYLKKSPEFNLADFKEQWKFFRKKNQFSEFTLVEIEKWVEETGLLFELTKDASMAEELEEVVYLNRQAKVYTDPFVFTKKTDKIHVNIFRNREIKFSHTMGGEVAIRQETDYPESGKIRIHFTMTNNRYIELHIRIPSWAEGTTATVKNVKYSTPPGDYCRIAKKWRNGDVVEIDLPAEKIPEFISHK